MKVKRLLPLALSALVALGGAAAAQTNADYMFSGVKHPSYDSGYAAIDEYVRGLSIPVSASYKDAAKKICAKSTTDIQKARAIFTWVASNIKYDVYFNSATCYDADGTWKQRSGVCQGYALLYNELAKAAGLNAEYVRGFSKNNSYKFGDEFGSHGWSLVHLPGRDLLLDPCWGAGNADTVRKTFEFDFKDCWFDVDPYTMIATHFPRESKYQGLRTPITQNKFGSLPVVSPAVNDGGIDGNELFEFYVSHNKAWFPLVYGTFMECVQKGFVFNKLPMADTLKAGESYTANIKIPSGYALYFSVDGSRISVPSGSDVTISPKKEQDVVLWLKKPSSSSLQGLLKYGVSSSPNLEYVALAAEANSQILSGRRTVADSGVVTTTTTSSGDVRVATVTDAADPGDSTEVTDVPDDNVTPLRLPARVSAPIQNSSGFRNAKGQIFDPYAKADFSKDGLIIGFVRVSFNKAGNQIKFIDKDNKKKTYGDFRYKEQFWKKYDSKLNEVNLNMEQFYTSINLYQTDLWRDDKGNCVGPHCTDVNPTVTQAQATANARKANKQGLGEANLSALSLTCTDGVTRDNQAHGRGKVLLFGKVACGNCRATASSIKSAGGSLGDVDVIEVEINRASREQVAQMKAECGHSSIPFAYDTKGDANRLMWNYLAKIGKTGSVTLGVIVYIDAENKVQFVESGYQTAAHIKQVVADYL